MSEAAAVMVGHFLGVMACACIIVHARVGIGLRLALLRGEALMMTQGTSE